MRVGVQVTLLGRRWEGQSVAYLGFRKGKGYFMSGQ